MRSNAAPLDDETSAVNHCSVANTKHAFGLGVLALGILVIYAMLPLETGLQLGGDEGYQLITSFLMSKGFVLYKDIWYDQPRVLVLLLELAFRTLGPSIFAARLIAAAFGLVLFAIFYQVVKLRSGRWTAILAAFFLLAAPSVLELSVSVMQEVPAFALALLSVLLVFHWSKRSHWSWVAASGAVMGLALATKLTGALVVPAIVVELVLSQTSKQHSPPTRSSFLPALQWSLAAGITLVCILLLWGRGGLHSSYQAHFATPAPYGAERPADFPMPLGVFFDHFECVLAAALGITLVIKRRQLRQFCLPAIWLATALVVHLFHRPWWMYYYLHLAIPMAWFAGIAIREATTPFFGLLLQGGLQLSSPVAWKALALSALAAVALVRSEQRVEGSVRDLQARTRVKLDPMLSKIKEYAGRTRWIYVRYTKEAYAFHAGLPMPPQLAVVSLKRFWSGQITISEIIDTCRRYQPEQILLAVPEVTSEWKSFLDQDYDLVWTDPDFVLYVAKRIK
jgi:4-amino-4-deoxy-L-arabinose transferase-like glycosyltransferase